MDKPILYEDIYGYNPDKFTKFDADVFKLRPSSIEQFFNFPVDWYKEYVLKQDKAFEGNTGSVLGTTLHYCYENALAGKALKKEDIDNALDYYSLQNPALFELAVVKELYPVMLNATLEGYINPLRQRGVPMRIEEEVFVEVGPKFVMRGLADLQYSTTLVDWKNVTTKPNTDKIPWKFKVQLMAYAHMLKAKGVHLDYVEIVYTVRPTKTLGARCFAVKERITQEDWKMIEDTINLIYQSVITCREKPELTHLIFKSMNLKLDINDPRR